MRDLRWIWMLLALVGCSDSPAPEPVADLIPPFPCDLYAMEDASRPSGVRVDLTAAPTPQLESLYDLGVWSRQQLQDWMGRLDGFSTFGSVTWIVPTAAREEAVSASSDGAQKEPAGPIFLVNVEPQGEALGQRVPIAVRQARIDHDVLGPLQVMVATPLSPLRPGERYAMVSLKAAFDTAAQQQLPSDFFAVLSGTRDLVPQSPYAAAMERLRTRADALFSYLESAGIKPAEVADAFVFTTQSARRTLQQVRELVRQAEPGAPQWGTCYTPETFPALPPGVDAAHLSGVSAILTGTLAVPDLRDAEGVVSSPPEVHGTLQLPFILALPDQVQGAAPVVMLMHGNSGYKELALHVAPDLAAEGIATVAIDHVAHGELKGDGPGFIDVFNLARLRSNFLQTQANALSLVRMLATLSSVEAQGKTVLLDTAKGVGYLGESLGGISGVGVCAVEPHISAAVFNVTPAGLATSLAGSILNAMGKNSLLLSQGFIAMFQGLLDAVDPVTFAGLLVREAPADARRPVMMQNVTSDSIGLQPVETLAATLGARYVCPCPEEAPMPRLERVQAPTGPPGLFYYAVGEHGFLLEEPSFPAASQAVRRQAAHFFGSHFFGAGAEIIDPLAP